MKTFLIVIGCILLYIFGVFVTFTMTLYIDRCEFGAQVAYKDIDESNFGIAFAWPVTIWFLIGYILFLKFKKFSIAIVEILYQVNHKENKDE